MKIKWFNRSEGFLFLAFAQIMVGVNIVCSKILLLHLPALVLLEIRFLMATIILAPIHWFTKSRQISLKKHFEALHAQDWFFLIAQALTAGVLFNAIMLCGLNYTDANVAGIITSALPAMIALMSWMFLNELISKDKLLCIIFATVGLLIIAYGKMNVLSERHSFFGDGLLFLALIPEASYYVLCKCYQNKLPIFLTSILLNGMNAVILLPVMFLMHWSVADMSLSSWAILTLIGFTSGLFYVFWFIGAQTVDGVLASLSTAIMPVSTVILAWVILKEDLSITELSGMGFVLFSIIFYAKR